MIHSQSAQQVIAFEYWYCENCPEFLESAVRIFWISSHVGDVDGPAFQRGAGRSAVSAGTNWILGYKFLKLLGSVESHRQPQQLAIEAVNERSVSPTQPD